MSIIELNQVSFGFDVQGESLFSNVSLTIQSSWKLGLIGRNGRGKTSLLKLLQGEYDYQGTIRTSNEFCYFPQKINDPSVFTYDLLQELSTAEPWKIERELSLLGLAEEILWRPYHSLSGGEQTKVLLGVLFAEENRYPLIDEPTNHLDRKARLQVAEYLKNKKQGFILVSHDRNFVDRVVDHVLAIEKSQLVLYTGNFSTYEEQKKLRDQYEIEQNKKLKKEIKRLNQTAVEKAEWSRGREGDKLQKSKGYNDKDKRPLDKGAIGADAARTMKRAKSILHRVERQATEKASLLKDIETTDSLKMNVTYTHHQPFIRAKHLQIGYDQFLFQPISFEVDRGDCIAISGDNGSGKSTLMNYLRGEFFGMTSGELEKVATLKVSVIRQNFEDNVGTLSEFAKKNQISYEELLNNLFKLGLERKVFNNRIEEMSMGQQKRVEVAKSLLIPAELYIWDEPLNYLDVFNREQMIALIQQVRPTMLVIEHDRHFIEQVATKVIELKKLPIS